MRRWGRHRHGLDLPHYAVSIVRGRGIDANALRWLAAHHAPADVVFVDVREQSELDATGRIEGSVHVSRGLLEAKTDPESSTHDPVLSSGKRLVTYCASGARAALAAKTLADMGVTRVAHVHGGIVQHQIADIDEMTVEDQRPHGFGHVAA